MKDMFNLKTFFPSYDDEDLQRYNFIGDRIILSVFIIFFCIVGLVGNGNVIWLLGFCIKRKPFAIYILNLAVADFGSLLFLLPLNIWVNPPYFHGHLNHPTLVGCFHSLHLLMYNSSQLLLTAISIDRWVSVLFPNWYRCHRSPALSTTVCAFMFALPFVLDGARFIQELTTLMPGYENSILGEYIASNLICPLLVVIFALTLFIKVFFKSQCCQRGNLLRVILLMFLSFLLFAILINVSVFVELFIPLPYYFLWASLKNSVNPLIYLLAGRHNGGKFQERMKAILQRVFKEERDTRMELQPRTQTPS